MGHRVEVRFHVNFPFALQDETRRIFEELTPFLARDVDIIQIYWQDQEDTHALINHSDQHREAHIALSAKWMGYDERERYETAAHELSHITVNRLTRRVEDLLEWFEENSNQNVGFARKTIEAAEEQVVTDISRTVLRAMGKWYEMEVR